MLESWAYRGGGVLGDRLPRLPPLIQDLHDMVSRNRLAGTHADVHIYYGPRSPLYAIDNTCLNRGDVVFR